MSYKITMSANAYGYPQATVALKCDHCGHTGTASFYSDTKPPEKYTWRRDTLTEDENGRGSFNWHEFNGNIYCTCVGELVFSAQNLPDGYRVTKLMTSANTEAESMPAASVIWKSWFHNGRKMPKKSPLKLLRKIARVSLHRLAKETDVDVRVLRAIERGEITASLEIADAVKATLRRRNLSTNTLSVLQYE